MRVSQLILIYMCTSFQALYANGNGLDTCAANGLRQMSAGNYSAAIKTFENCLSADPGNARLYFQKGTCYLLLKKPGIALVDFNQALLLDSTLYETFYNRGLAQQALSNYTFSEADLLIYRSRVPGDHKAIKNLAMLMEDMLDYNAAVKYYSEYLALYPDDVEVRKSRALTYASLNRVNDAIADLDICLKTDISDTAILMCKGNVYFDALMFDKAIDAYNVVLFSYPEFRAALLNRADAYNSAGRYEEAVRDYTKLSLNDKYNAENYFNLGFCYLQLNRNQDAIIYFGKALDTDYPNIGLLLTLRGVAYNNMKMQQEACSDWQKAINTGYKDASAYLKNYCR